MARDYEDLHDLDDLGDDELRELAREALRANRSVDATEIDVQVERGAVRLIGRVGTEGEARVAEHVLTDVLGLGEVSNELTVDQTRRAESPEDLEEHLADEARHDGLLLGDRPVSLSPESAHLDEDRDAQLYGTTDRQKSIEEGAPWIPPESPTPEGFSGEEGGSADHGEHH